MNTQLRYDLYVKSLCKAITDIFHWTMNLSLLLLLCKMKHSIVTVSGVMSGVVKVLLATCFLSKPKSKKVNIGEKVVASLTRITRGAKRGGREKHRRAHPFFQSNERTRFWLEEQFTTSCIIIHESGRSQSISIDLPQETDFFRFFHLWLRDPL